MWELDYKESWRMKNWCFWTVVLGLLRVAYTAWRSNQSILKEVSPGYSLEGMMMKLKLQYFGHLIRWTDSLEQTLMLGKTEGGRRSDWMASLTWCRWVWISSRSWWWTGKPGMLQTFRSQRAGHDWVTEMEYEFHFLTLTRQWKVTQRWKGKFNF